MRKNLLKILVLLLVISGSLSSCTTSSPVCPAYVGPLIGETHVDKSVNQKKIINDVFFDETWPAKWKSRE